VTGSSEEEWETSLGPPLVKVQGTWRLDVASLPIVHGLSILSRALAEMAMAQIRGGAVVVDLQRSLRPRENPELIEVYGLSSVNLLADAVVVDRFADDPDAIERQLRALLGSLQRKRYRDALLAAVGHDSQALIAEFPDDPMAASTHATRYVLERVTAEGAGGVAELRIVIQSEAGGWTEAGDLPHVLIDDVAERQFIAGSTRIAQSWTEALRREAVRSRRSFFEQRAPHSHLFHQLDQAGLTAVQQVSVHWCESVLPVLIESEPSVCEALFKRVLLALEDRGLRRLLEGREAVCVIAGAVPVFVDISQLGRVLTFSVGQSRARDDARAFLARMPSLSEVVEERGGSQPLESVSVFLVHHMTAEIVGLIAALRALGCRDLTVLFVSYSGQPPASYLDAVLDLPSDEFCALSLVNLPQRGSVEGTYRLSSHYSQLDPDDERDVLRSLDGSMPYLDAMRAVAVVPFLRQVARAEARGERCLLVEDGGYLAPVLLDAISRGVSVGQFGRELGYSVDDERSLEQAVGRRVLGVVEHTRNGFDRLEQVLDRRGSLPLPTYSIAISKLKRMVESREVAASVLSATESVLNASGRVLSRRSCLILGSRGAIGGELCRHLRSRLDEPSLDLACVDLKVDESGGGDDLVEARCLAGLPAERWLDVDLVVGVTGESVLQGADIERWLLRSAKPSLALVSGSTKKVEFAAVMDWFDRLMASTSPMIGDVAATIAVEELLDPRTARVYGHRWLFTFSGDRPSKEIVTLANLTPVNFLFYGVATEIIDEVLAQLLSLSLAAVRQADSPLLRGGLLAVDREIDADGRLLS